MEREKKPEHWLIMVSSVRPLARFSRKEIEMCGFLENLEGQLGLFLVLSCFWLIISHKKINRGEGKGGILTGVVLVCETGSKSSVKTNKDDELRQPSNNNQSWMNCCFLGSEMTLVLLLYPIYKLTVTENMWVQHSLLSFSHFFPFITPGSYMVFSCWCCI